MELVVRMQFVRFEIIIQFATVRQIILEIHSHSVKLHQDMKILLRHIKILAIHPRVDSMLSAE